MQGEGRVADLTGLRGGRERGLSGPRGGKEMARSVRQKDCGSNGGVNCRVRTAGAGAVLLLGDLPLTGKGMLGQLAHVLWVVVSEALVVRGGAVL